MTTLFDLLLLPFNGFAPGWGLVALSAVSGVIFLLIYGRCSNQAKLREVKRNIGATLLETVLFRRDFGLCLQAQGRLFGLACRYLFLAVPPIVILAIPGLIILAQLNLRYGVRPLQLGEHALLKVRLERVAEVDRVVLSTSPGIHATAPVRIRSTGEVVWRLDAVAISAPQQVVVRVAGASAELQKLIFTAPTQPVAARAYNVNSWWRWLFYPGETLLDGKQGLTELVVSYPPAQYRLLGYEIHWLVTFLVVSLLSGLVAAKVFRIEI